MMILKENHLQLHKHTKKENILLQEIHSTVNSRKAMGDEMGK